VLGLYERRVLGVLVEKAKTTPDVYPLSINALIAGCNQKSNRDPIIDMSDVDVEDALVSTQKKGLAIKIVGGRVIRWRHALYEAWKVDKVDLAILGELLLRGPQTEGDLRSRASRMESIDTLDALRAELRPLAERRLVVYLSPEGRRGTMLTHGFHAPDELERLRARHGAGAAEEEDTTPGIMRAQAASAIAPNVVAGLQNRLNDTDTAIAELRSQVAGLQSTVAGLADQVRALREALGG